MSRENIINNVIWDALDVKSDLTYAKATMDTDGRYVSIERERFLELESTIGKLVERVNSLKTAT